MYTCMYVSFSEFVLLYTHVCTTYVYTYKMIPRIIQHGSTLSVIFYHVKTNSQLKVVFANNGVNSRRYFTKVNIV